MATNKSTLKVRSVTYPTSDSLDHGEGSSGAKKVRGKLKRMDSVDYEASSNCGGHNQFQFQQVAPPNTQFLFPSSNLSATRERDLSLEGRLRVHHFQQTHSASSPLAPGKKLLRFSDGSLGGRNGSGTHQHSFGQHIRSTSCLPLSKHRGSHSPKTSSTALERLVDWQRPSFDRPSLSPHRSQDRNDPQGQTSSGATKHRSGKTHEKKLERFYSSDCPEPSSRGSSATRSPPCEPHQTGATTASSSGDTRSRRSQFRRAISLFSLSCDKETERERSHKSLQKILRPPTRHVYRRGLSGLPIECTSRSLGVVY